MKLGKGRRKETSIVNNPQALEKIDCLPESGLDENLIREYLVSSVKSNRWQNSKLNAGRVLAIPDEFAVELRNLSEAAANVHLSSPVLSNAYYNLEDTLGRMVLDFLGHPKPQQGGFLSTHGVTSALTEAIHNSRCRYQEMSFQQEKRLAILAPVTSNVAVKKAAKLTGLGTENVIFYDLDEGFQPDAACLEDIFSKASASRQEIITAVTVAGDTEHGIIQDAARLAPAKKAGNYSPDLLIDAAFGWYFLAESGTTFSCPEIDFIAMDFNKWLGTMSHAMLLLKDGEKLKYSLLEEDREAYDSESWGFPYSRQHFLRSRAPVTRLGQGAHSIPSNLGVLLKYGKQSMADMAYRMRELAKEFSEYIRQSEAFELIVEPQTGIVSFSSCSGKNYRFMEEFNKNAGPNLAYSTTIRCRRKQELEMPVAERDGFWIHFMPYADRDTLNGYIDRLNKTLAR
ncbi:MAG: hypothetical protein HY519_02280 [Candidatus Aenigmarchaeota archaeon]|nr:hypothetical protein [Candidatus Aenigmarchaeota archaeon]